MDLATRRRGVMASGHPFSTSQVKKAKEAINILSSILGEQSEEQGPSNSSASVASTISSRAQQENDADIDSKGSYFWLH